jgi:hypothetical protein
MAFWTAGALAVTSLMVCRRYSRAAAQWLACAAMLILALQSTRLIGWQLEQYPLKQDRASRWISISEHTDRLLGPVPAGATAWGAVMYGIETPRRIQLIQVTEGLVLLPRVRDDQKPALLPEFLIWGYPEVRDNAIGVLRGENSLLNQVADVLPGATYRLASLVAAAPYGVSRVYARTTALPPHDTLPQVHVYDAAHRYWRTQISQPLPAVFAPTPPVRIRLGYTGDTPAAAATSTMSAELPAGTYLLKVGIRPGAGNSRRRLLAATSRAELDQTIGELGPRGDFAGYFLDQTTVWLLGEHDGGPLFVSQFDDGQGASRCVSFPSTAPLTPSTRLRPLRHTISDATGHW